MPFTRILDDSYPHIYDEWQQDGLSWVIQDLPTEDHEEAIKVLKYHLCTDEVLCSIVNLIDEHESVENMCDVWRYYLSMNTSLGCYVVEEGVKKLVALNVCYVCCEGEEENIQIKGDKWIAVYGALDYCNTRFDVFKHLGVNKLLEGMGLVVSKNYRGSKLGARILAARDPLCRLMELKGISTVFTGIASQKLAALCGYTTALEVRIGDLAEAGLKFPREETRSIKLMIKKVD